MLRLVKMWLCHTAGFYLVQIHFGLQIILSVLIPQYEIRILARMKDINYKELKQYI